MATTFALQKLLKQQANQNSRVGAAMLSSVRIYLLKFRVEHRDWLVFAKTAQLEKVS